jgi:hypothetical protein
MAIPALPVEILILIFRDCTLVPGSLDTSILSPVSFEPRAWKLTSDDAENSPVQMDYRTKTNLALVSRAFYTLALPYLYEHVSLSLEKQLQALSVTFGCIDMRHVPLESHIGRYVKRIDIRFRNADGQYDPLSADAVDQFNHIYRRCPNLEIFCHPGGYTELQHWYNLGTPRTDPMSTISDLLYPDAPVAEYIASPRLRYIEWGARIHSNFDRTALNIAHNFSSTLEVLALHLSMHDVSFVVERIAFPHLHTLRLAGKTLSVIERFANRMASCDLPRIERLYLSTTGRIVIDYMAAFTDAHGAKLRYIEISHPQTPRRNFLETPRFIDLTTANRLTGLQNIVLHCAYDSVVLPLKLSTIKVVTIHCSLLSEDSLSESDQVRQDRIVHRMTQQVLPVMTQLRLTHAPIVSCVRLLHINGSAFEHPAFTRDPSMKIPNMWKRAMNYLKERKITVECDDGPLVFPDSWNGVEQ